MAIFTKNEEHSQLFPNIVPKDYAKIQNFFDILLTSLRFLINIIRNHSALQDRVVSRQIKSELPANKKSFFKLFF